MGMNLTYKILDSHLMEGDLSNKQEIALTVDQTLCHDLTGIMAAQIMEAVGASEVKTEASVFYCDHNVIAASSENSEDHRYLKGSAEKYGIYFSKPGNGICHFVHCQQFAKPGKLMLGADSHTPTSGALGMLAIGSGGLSVAKAMLGEGFRMTPPKVYNIELKGELETGVSAKDITLEILKRISVKGGLGYILEFTGDGIKYLSVPQRATIANMTIEMGAITGVFPSDDVTKAYLEAQGRGDDWVALTADADATYDNTLTIDLSNLVPLAAKPHMPDLVEAAAKLSDVKANSVFIGSCTNASYSDIAKAAAVLKGKKVHKDVDLTVAPGSIQVFEALLRDGIISTLVDAGARVLENACGPCIGIGQVPPGGGVAVRTSNRNFMGRSGNNDANVYLVSPETAAATAINGYITDPRDFIDCQILADIKEPDLYGQNNVLMIEPQPQSVRDEVEIMGGENIKPLPMRGRLDEAVEAPVVLKLGDNITTDDIIPGGANILKFIANIPQFAEYTFCYTDPTFVSRAKVLGESIIVGGENYGQGSSREHAALLPMFLGVKAVIAKSYARIHKENLINYGILPFVFENADDYEKLGFEDTLVLKDLYAALDNDGCTVLNKTTGEEVTLRLELSVNDKEILKVGGALNFLKEKQEMTV